MSGRATFYPARLPDRVGDLEFDGVATGPNRYSIALERESGALRLAPMFHAIQGLNFYPVRKLS